jgi:hypothetical protein
MLIDLKWFWFPFSRIRTDELRIELKRMSDEKERCWLFGDFRANSVVREIIDRIASRAQGLLAILAIPFSIFAYVFSREPSVTPLAVITLCSLVACLLFLFRCMIITWAPAALLTDPVAAYDHYFRVMITRIRSFYLGVGFGMATLVFLLLQL